MTIRIVLTGPECTGKTTLAQWLAERFGAPWVPEASREYAAASARVGRTLTASDVEPIARMQIEREDRALAGQAFAFLDTDLLSTVAYARHYYGTSSEWLEGAARARVGALYLLCAPDIPWSADGIRDRPEGREEMFAHFARVLTEFAADVRVVRGVGEARLDAAATTVAEHSALRSYLTPTAR